MINEKLTKRDARKVLSIVDAGLVSGLGKPEPGHMCVEAAICFALGYEFNDQPKCVAEFMRRYKIKINDARWSSKEARTKGMRRAAVAQLGSNFLDLAENKEIRKECVQYIVEQTIRRILPLPLRRAAKKHKDKIQAERLIEAALRCENEGTRASAVNARDVGRAAYAAADARAAYADDAAAAAAYAAAAADAAYAAAAAAYAAAAADAYAAAAAAAYADDAAAYADAAYAAAAYAAAAADAAAYADADAARDNILNTAAEICVEACIKARTPGSKWLDITDEQTVA